MSGMTLVTFLRARLDEDEAVALACEANMLGAHVEWWHEVALSEWSSEYVMRATDGLSPVVAELHSATNAAHIARHDPARVLADVQAKRAIVDLLYKATIRLPWPPAWSEPYALGLEEAARHLAAVYADHPDYDEKWRP